MGEDRRRKVKLGHSDPRTLVSVLMPKGMAILLNAVADHAKVSRSDLIVTILVKALEAARQASRQDTLDAITGSVEAPVELATKLTTEEAGNA